MSGPFFNPPPMWPVLRGWTPPPDWEPDPSWPPAPAGWQFWVEYFAPIEETKQPWGPHREPGAPGRRKWALIAGAATLVVALTVGTVAVVSWLSKDDLQSVARPEGMLPATYPTAPKIEWSIEAEDLTAGAEPAFVTPLYGAAYYGSTGAIVVGNHVIIQAVPDRSSPEDAQRISISQSDGRVEWATPSNASDGCAGDLFGDVLACKNSENYGRTSQLEFIDINTGAVRSTASVPFYLNMLASDGKNLYTAGYREPEGLVVAKGTAADPTSGWQVSIPGGACESHGSGDSYDLRVREGIVYGFQGGGEYIALHASDGSPIFDHPVSEVSVLGGPTVTARRCIANGDLDNWPTEVADGAGTLLFTTDERLVDPPLDVRVSPPSVLVTASGVGLDAKTGERLWRQKRWPTNSLMTAVIGDTLLYEDGVADALHAGALVDGSELWNESPAAVGSDAFTDGRNLISASKAEIRARSLTDGQMLWSTFIPKVSDNDFLVLKATDRGLLFVTGTQIGMYRPTGPPAPVP